MPNLVKPQKHTESAGIHQQTGNQYKQCVCQEQREREREKEREIRGTAKISEMRSPLVSSPSAFAHPPPAPLTSAQSQIYRTAGLAAPWPVGALCSALSGSSTTIEAGGSVDPGVCPTQRHAEPAAAHILGKHLQVAVESLPGPLDLQLRVGPLPSALPWNTEVVGSRRGTAIVRSAGYRKGPCATSRCHSSCVFIVSEPNPKLREWPL